ncbi:MAG: hypothetical protein ABI691_23705 [Ginsengibacter sp.]
MKKAFNKLPNRLGNSQYFMTDILGKANSKSIKKVGPLTSRENPSSQLFKIALCKNPAH